MALGPTIGRPGRWRPWTGCSASPRRRRRFAGRSGSASRARPRGPFRCSAAPPRPASRRPSTRSRGAISKAPGGHLGYALSRARRALNEPGRLLMAEHLRQAAEAGLPTAIYLLAVVTEQGVGVAADAALAAQLYHQAAERGHRAAQARWGLALMEGRGVEQDRVVGESWLRRAALAGDAEAAARVGDLYVQNGALPPNFAEAAAWYRRAAGARPPPAPPAA